MFGRLCELPYTLKVGDSMSSNEIEMGYVISKNQQERILGFIDRATV
jgi:hypothetical protein